ncbi:hypothetical protein [Mycolicibacterium pallens]|nr:hypothetical protein [Mycolicibacterium pallens]
MRGWSGIPEPLRALVHRMHINVGTHRPQSVVYLSYVDAILP